LQLQVRESLMQKVFMALNAIPDSDQMESQWTAGLQLFDPLLWVLGIANLHTGLTFGLDQVKHQTTPSGWDTAEWLDAIFVAERGLRIAGGGWKSAFLYDRARSSQISLRLASAHPGNPRTRQPLTTEGRTPSSSATPRFPPRESIISEAVLIMPPILRDLRRMSSPRNADRLGKSHAARFRHAKEAKTS
jgi:hypothetical protein